MLAAQDQTRETKKQEYTLSDLKRVVKKWLLLESDIILDVLMGTYLSNQLASDPIWMMIISPPSNGKTELLRAFSGLKGAHFLSSLTPATLVSGLPQKKNCPEPSLLPRLNGKTLILKDFTSVLSLRSEAQQEILSQLREIFDGQYSKSFGNGITVNWSGRVGFIGACTPVFDKHHASISSLGDRFLLYRVEATDQAGIGLKALCEVGQEEQMREEISEAYKAFLGQFSGDDIHITIDDNLKRQVVALASFVAYGRTAVDRERYTQAISYIPLPEGSPRLTKQFAGLGIGIAQAHKKEFIDDCIMDILKRVALSIIPGPRRKIIEYLWRKECFSHLLGWQTTKDIAEGVCLPKATCRLICEDLALIGLLKSELTNEDDDGRKPWKWQLTDKAYDLAVSSAVFNEIA